MTEVGVTNILAIDVKETVCMIVVLLILLHQFLVILSKHRAGAAITGHEKSHFHKY